MEAVKIIEKSNAIDWDYDGDADVLYISIGKPVKSLGVDIGEGVIIRYDDSSKELTGITIIGLRERSANALG